MPTVISQLDAAFRQAIRAAFDLDADPLLTVSQNDKFGDYQSNAAMSLAKQVAEKTGQKTNPRQVAEQIKGKLELGAMAQEVSIAGPGFINVRLSAQWLSQQTQSIAADKRLGIARHAGGERSEGRAQRRPGSPPAETERVVVDYSGPNIAKQMHVGHLRSTIIGDAIARNLDFLGDHVIRQNHLGDWGTQFGRVVLAMWYEAVFARTGRHAKLDELFERQQKAAREKDQAALAAIVYELGELHQDFVNQDPDGTRFFLPYLRDNALDLDELERAYVFVSAVTDAEEAKQVSIRHPLHDRRTLAELPRLVTTFIQNPNLPENQQEKFAWEKARDVTRIACNEIYQRLGVQLADQSVQEEPLEMGESSYNRFLPDVVAELKSKGLAIESDGATVVQVPGFENPLIIEKKGGGFLYGTTDLAAVRYRVRELRANRILYFVDARQSQHFQQVFWTARAAGWAENVSLEHAAFGTMLGEDGKPFKSRSGEVVKLKDLLDEAEQRATAVVASKNPDLPESQRTQIAHAIGVGAMKYADLSKDRISDYFFSFDQMLSLEGNTAPYLQYAHARIKSIFRRAAERGITFNPSAPVNLESPYELALIKHVLRLGEVLEAVARELKPHHLTNYLYELSTRFSGFFENCPVIQSEEPVRASRLVLVDVTARTLALGLDLLGIEHPEQM
jgi:arginyl-tRNA synthetase